MMQDSGAQLQEDMAQARSGICSTVEVIHENTLSLLHFFSEGGLEIPQKMSALAAKMAAQVAEADGGGYGPPLAARGLAAVLSGASTPMSASIAKVQDWQTNPSLLDSLSPGDSPSCTAYSCYVILRFRGSLCSSDGAVMFRLSSHAADVMRVATCVLHVVRQGLVILSDGLLAMQFFTLDPPATTLLHKRRNRPQAESC